MLTRDDWIQVRDALDRETRWLSQAAAHLGFDKRGVIPCLVTNACTKERGHPMFSTELMVDLSAHPRVRGHNSEFYKFPVPIKQTYSTNNWLNDLGNSKNNFGSGFKVHKGPLNCIFFFN